MVRYKSNKKHGKKNIFGTQKYKHEVKNRWNALSKDGKVFADKWLYPYNVKEEAIQDCRRGWFLLRDGVIKR